MKVPLADLHAQYLTIKPEIDSAVQKILDSSQFILGKAVADFEKSFADAHKVKHCIAVGSGTDALHAVLWAMGIGKGDAVITSPFTFIATVEAISMTGARPVFVDIDPQTYTMDSKKLEQMIRTYKGAEKLNAILPIHLYGQTAQMDEIVRIAKENNLQIVEDACQSHMATFNGTYVGNFGAAACFSFYPGKNLGAYGEAGGITTNDDALALKLRQLRDHGQVEKYKHAFEGHNYRMDGIQGAVLGVKMNYLNRWTARRQEIAAKYTKALSGVGDLVLPYVMPKAQHVFHVFSMRSKQRSKLQQFLADQGVSTALHYPIPLHFQQAYQHLGYNKGDFPVSEIVADECISLPLYPELTEEQITFVIDSVRSFFQD